MTGRGTALLFALLVVLAGYLWVAELERGARVRPPPPAPAGPPLLAATPAELAGVELEEAGVQLRAERHGDTWTDGQGRPWRGDAVTSLLGTLATLRPVMVIDPHPANPADYGLGPPAARLRVIGRDGQPLLALELGERNPAWTALYARRVGTEEVILVGSVLRWELGKLRDTAPDHDS
jgi:hypothetical protein